MKNYLLYPAIILFIFMSLNACVKSKTTCIDDKMNVDHDTIERFSKIQLIHAAPNTKGIKIWIDDTTTFQVGYYFKSNTAYLDILPGNRKVEIKRSKTVETLYTINQDILPQTKYSIFALDSQNTFTGLLIKDEPLPIDQKKAQLRIVNLLSTNETIITEFDNTNLFNPINFKSASPYEYVTPGVRFVSFYKDNNQKSKILEHVLINLDPGAVYTLYINGFTNAIGTYAPDAILVVNL